jgi:PAS domain S-box-containing protein
VDPRPLLEHVISTGPTVIFRRTAEDLVTYVSPNVERILGYSPEEVVGVPGFWAARVHPDDRGRFLAQARQAFAAEATELERDYRFQHKDGTYRWLHARTNIEYDETGAPEALLGYAMDMTEQRSAEEQNAQLFAFPLALVFVAGLDGYFKRVSAGYERLLGWTEQELLSRPFFEFVHPQDVEVVGASIQEVAAGRAEVINQEVRVLCKDGTYRWLLGNYRPVPDEGLMYGMAVDITQRKRTEVALRESERRTRLILAAAHEAFISMDAYGRIVDWNAEAERVFGWPREEALGRVLSETIVPERYRADHIRGLDRYLATGEGPLLGRRVEIEALRRDGSEFPVELTISPARLDGTVVFNAFLREVTERKRGEEALHAARVEAERANQAKSEFLSRMSHELRTPLNAILGFSQLLKMEGLEPGQEECVQQIMKGGKHLLDLINEVLEIARIESGRLTFSLEPIVLAEALQEALDLIQPLAAEQGIELKTGEPWPSDRYVEADRQRLKQVLLNLLSNAVKYNRPGGSVTIRCMEVPAEELRIEVTDEGPGIPPEMIDRLFVPFDRLGAEGTGVEGTGLGLALSQRLTEAMGGTLGVDSVPGRGSTFFIELPLAEAPETSEEETEAAGRPSAGGPKRAHTLLYIEDNTANLKLIERALTFRPDLGLLSAMQGSLGLDLARQHQPDLIMLDLHLPDISGEELLRQLQGDPRTRDIPVIVISADATPGRVQKLLAAGARAYLTKPLDMHRFFVVVDDALEARKLDHTG